jgi:hypothetical protein
VLLGQLVLALPYHEVLGRVDEQHVVGLFALLKDEDADRDTGRIKKISRQAEHGVDVPILQQLAANALLRPRRATARRAAGPRKTDFAVFPSKRIEDNRPNRYLKVSLDCSQNAPPELMAQFKELHGFSWSAMSPTFDDSPVRSSPTSTFRVFLEVAVASSLLGR